MKTIILAAGKSQRLRYFTEGLPKPMVKIKGKPILEHNIEWLKGFGIEDIYINLHYLPHLIKDYFKDGRRWKVKISYSYESEPLGTAGGVKKILREFWNLSERKEFFLVIYGDNLYRYDLNGMIDFHKKNKGISTIGLYRKEGDLSQSGVAFLDENNLIIRFFEKPKKKIESNLVNTGIYILEYEILNFIPDRYSDFCEEIFPFLIRNRLPIFGFIMPKGELICIDTPELYEEARIRYDNYKNSF